MVPQEVAGIRIVHDDADLVVVDKPAGVAAHPSLGWDGPSVVEHLAAAGFRISTSGAAERQGIVQRLDVGTSGLMVVAKSETAYTALKRAFRSRTVKRCTTPWFKASQTLWKAPSTPHSSTPGCRLQDGRRGRWAAQHHPLPDAGGLPLRHPARSPSRNRTHTSDSRPHAGDPAPCVGDPTYGGDPVLAARLGLERQWLHAVELGFQHPANGELMRFTSDYPADLATALARVAAEA